LWWADLLSAQVSLETQAVFIFGILITCMSLAAGWHVRGSRKGVDDDGLKLAIDDLADRQPMNLAVFPVTAAEYVAFATHHAVLWGGHGYGFDNLEPIFPVVSKPIGQTISTHNCDAILFDSNYWPDGEGHLHQELPGCDIRSFGRWRLVDVGRP
jgi:hypothetical protein